ncbi:HD domain-containing protein [Patescibacteria group bacterium]|nr:HD domain-containing protein [Patescibacteria group bacterium]
MQWSEFKSHIRHLSSADLDRVKMAFERGKEAHDGQKRKSGEPYFTHCIAVAHLLADMRADADTIIAALLHDAVEDTSLTLEIIAKEFDHSVPALIDGVTKLDSSELKENPTLEQETETIRKIFTYMQEDVRIMVIKLADRMHNMQTLRFLDPERQKSLAEETLSVYVKIADRLSMRKFRDELESLCIEILEPDLFVQLIQLRKKNEKTNEKNIQNILACLNASHPSLAPNFTIQCEPKSWGRLHAQLDAEGSAATGVSALTAVFVCKDIEICYKVFGSLHQCYQRETLSFEDFINSPQINGYQGLHTTVILGDGTRVRCKIRTQEMNEYAHNGIITKCFDSEATGLLDYLPWTDRIATLSEDTTDRSGQFFASLQSDILGDSILIHGHNDKTIMLPKGSTALDGAIYLFEESALAATSIKVNGKEVTFSTPLEHAASVDLIFKDKPTVKREWLEWVQTGLATATIRTALAQQSSRQKIRIGQRLAQEELREHNAGFLDEFNQESVVKGLQSLGYSSVNDAYIAIADGHLEPEEIYEAIFTPESAKSSQKKTFCTIRYAVPMDDPDVHSKLAKVHQEFHAYFKQVRYIQQHSTKRLAFTKVKVHIEPNEQKIYISKLKAAGATHVNILPTAPIYRLCFGICLIMLLWGLDPVVASHIIKTHSLSAIDLTIVRFWSLTGISATLLLWQNARHKLPETPLPLKSKSLWASVLLLICISLSTYFALQTTNPANYTISMTAAGIVTTSFVNRKRWRILLMSFFFIVVGNVVLIAQSPSWPWFGVLTTLLAVCAFTAFSVVSEQYKEREHVAARSAQYFFVLSVLCFLLTLPLIPFSTITSLSNQALGEMVLFSVFLAGLPYYLYYFYLTHRELDFVLRYSFLIIFASVGGQLFIRGSVDWPVILIAGPLVILGAVLPMITSRKKTS